MSTRTDYVEPGTLTRPGPIGRIVRLVAGLAALFALSQVILFKDNLLQNRIATGEAWGPFPGAVLGMWMAYTYGHLGISFVIATAIATPGCEMRALPHLWTLLSGRPTAEHHCPGPLSRVDRWEAGLGRN